MDETRTIDAGTSRPALPGDTDMSGLDDAILLSRMHAAYERSFVGQLGTADTKAELRAASRLYGKLAEYLSAVGPKAGTVEDRKKIAAAIFDPGATEGYKGDRTLTEWQTDAVMRALAGGAL